MTDHPSNPPSQTAGEEIAGRWFDANTGHPPVRLARLIDSALAAQEARHKAEMEAKDAEWIDRARRYFDIDPAGKLAKVLAEHYAPGSVLADVVMHEVWKRNPDVQEAESKLREAAEREKALREALTSLMNDDGSSASLPAYDTRCVLALAAIRSGPANTPMTKTIRSLMDEQGVMDLSSLTTFEECVEHYARYSSDGITLIWWMPDRGCWWFMEFVSHTAGKLW